MGIKRRAVEVKFSNDEKLIVHEPAMQDLGVFLRAIPALNALGRAFKTIDDSSQGIEGLPVEISDSVLERIFPLFGVMCEMTTDEFKKLPLWDGMGVLRAFGEFAPNSEATKELEPVQTSDPLLIPSSLTDKDS